MELTIFSNHGTSCTLFLDDTGYEFFMANPNYSENISKTFSLPVKIPAELFDPDTIASFLVPGGEYSDNTLDALLSDGILSRPCRVTFEKNDMNVRMSKGDVLNISIEYSELPIAMMGAKIADMDLGSWKFDQALSVWATFHAREDTNGLIAFPMIYAPEYFKKNYDDKFQGDTDYINWQNIEHYANGTPYLLQRPIRIFIYDPNHPEDWELFNDNAVIPCIHLLSLLRVMFDKYGFRFDSSALPSYFDDIYISTLKYPDMLPEVGAKVEITGGSAGEKTFPVGDPGSNGSDWIFFEKYIDIPRQYGGCTVTVKLNSGTLYACRDADQLATDRPGYGKLMPTVFKCVIDDLTETDLEIEGDSLIRETIEANEDLDKNEMEFKFMFTRKSRGNGYLRPRIQFRGSNVINGSAYGPSVIQPYVEDLQASIEYSFDHKKTYEMHLRPKDNSAYVEIKTVDFINFETFADFYTALKNTFGLVLAPSSDNIVKALSSSVPGVSHNFQEYSPASFSRQYNDITTTQIKTIIIKSKNENLPVISISPEGGVKIYPDTASYEADKPSDADETVKDSGFFPLQTKRQMAAFSPEGMGDNNIFFAPPATIEGYKLNMPYKAVAKLQVGEDYISLDPEYLYKAELENIFNSIYRKEQYEIQVFLPINLFFQINSSDRIYICGREFEIVELQAENKRKGMLVTFTLLG